MKADTTTWQEALDSSQTEEDVKAAYATTFQLKYNTSDRHDLYTPSALFEFKYDKNLARYDARSKVLAQLLYYIRELRFGSTKKSIPEFLILADKNECAITETILWEAYVTSENYDWDLSPSSPDPAMVRDLADDAQVQHIHVYDLKSPSQQQLAFEAIQSTIKQQQKIIKNIKKVITEDNFTEVFEYWQELFGAAVENGTKASTYFIQDIQPGKSHLIKDQGKVIFELEHGEARTKKIVSEDYEYFWSLYEKVNTVTTIRGIVAKIDRINDMTTRRFEGEFYTPLPFAKKGIEYLQKTFGNNWHKKKIRIWDMAAGTGNLEWYLPNQMALELYVSTLHQDEVEHCEKLFLGATCFQYDYLNDDVDAVLSDNVALVNQSWKLPVKLRQELADPDIQWIVLINPPFGTAQTAGANHLSKKNVSASKVQTYMHEAKLGEVSRELFEQFLYRISKELPLERTHLGLFSTLKFINATNDRKFRDLAFQYEFQRGFIFAAKNFHGTKGKFPVGFTIWDLSKQQHLESQHITLDVFSDTVHKIGSKTIATIHRDNFLSRWIERPRNTRTFPAFKSAITIANDNVDTRDRICDDFIGSLDNAGNDVQNSNRVGIYSGPFATAGAHSITPDNFEKSMVIHSVRKIIPNTWVNDRDQFLQPASEVSREFIIDCAVWSLFSTSNQTSTLKNVHYKNEVYQISNQFFPFVPAQVSQWPISDSDIALSILHASTSFVADWLERQQLSAEASQLLTAGKLVYKIYFANLAKLRTPKFKIETWDAGWWQVRNALRDESLASGELEQLIAIKNRLRLKLLQQIYEYKFITTEIDIT